MEWSPLRRSRPIVSIDYSFRERSWRDVIQVCRICECRSVRTHHIRCDSLAEVQGAVTFSGHLGRLHMRAITIAGGVFILAVDRASVRTVHRSFSLHVG